MAAFVTRNFGVDIWNANAEDGRLKPEFAQCVRNKLGPGAEHSGDNIDLFLIPKEVEEGEMVDVEEGEIAPKEKAVVGNFGTSPFVMSQSAALSDRVVAAIESCANPQAAGRGKKKSKKTRKSRKVKKSTRRH